MKRSSKYLVGVFGVLLACAGARAELKLVGNFDGMTGTPDGQTCNGVLGATIDTESEGTGNVTFQQNGGSTTLSPSGHSSGTLSRAAGVAGINNPIANDETGVAFFRFAMATGNTIRSHLGLIADTGNNPINATRTADPKTIPAGFRMVDNGTGYDLVTLDGGTVLKPGLARSQWYNVWIVADNSADTFDLYLSKATAPAGPATLPQAADLIQSAIPFTVAASNPLAAIIFACPLSPTGSGAATRIYVDEIWWDGDQGLSKPVKASSPNPADRATDVSRDVILSWLPGPSAALHDVYFGTSADAVGAAERANPQGVLVSQGQTDSTFDPVGSLAYGQTYYWRVDEINAPPDATVFKGSVWSFTVEPVSYPIAKVTATASSTSTGMGPERSVDGSGLNANGQHGTGSDQMWLSALGAPEPTWIQYAFDGAYKLDRLLVWNSNQMMEPAVGVGAKNVTVEYSADAATWTKLGDFEFARAPGQAGYTSNTTVNFAGAVAQYVRLTIHNNWGGLLAQYGLSEVRFLYVPVLPRDPVPAVGATGVEVDAVLTWRAGREAASHQVRLGTDQQAVTTGAAAAQTVSASSLDPGPLNLGQTYFWKVTEVNEAQTPKSWEGAVWRFATKEYLVVEDFEAYTDEEGNRIYETWTDGWTNGTGSVVGHLQAPFAERTIIHGGKQSMPFEYNNVKTPYYSEAGREFSPVQNWTVNGADTLRLWVRGNPVAYVDNAGTITMSAGGHDIWDNADDFRLAHKTLNGNGSVVVRVESLVNTNAWAKAGVMIRQSLDADSKFAYMIVSATSGVSCGWRQQTGGTCGSATQANVAAPQWVKLTRASDAFSAQYSADGKTWVDLKNADGTVVSTTVTMTGPVFVGLCVTSHSTAAVTTAVMSGAATTGNVTGAWQVAAIGDDPQPANSPADLYVAVEDSAGKAAVATHPTAVTTGVWTEWKIPLSSFTGVNLSRVKKLSVGAGSRTNPAPSGAGTLYFDDLGFGHPAQ
ncbi:MAG: discoidin domain-containing protein [Planctomycetes bacterium]|nr:discoidin domain-containing protein [Planctomycetota bacterium]